MMALRSRLPVLAGCLALAAAAGPAMAEPRIGTAVRVVNEVTADTRPLATGDGVSQDETIEARPASLGELKLDDETKLALGPGARLKLDRFIYDPSGADGEVAVSLLKGAFRFITGAAAKKDYKIRTPGAAISVRGTVFDIYIADNGAEYLLLHQGAIEVCKGDGTDRSNCRVLVDVCNVIRVSPQGGVGRPRGWRDRSSELELTFSEAFPFVLTPPQIDPVVYNTRADVEANTCNRPWTPVPTDRADLGPPDTITAFEPPPGPTPGDRRSPPPTPPPFSWTGLYVGVHGGGTRRAGDNLVTCSEATSVDDTCGSFEVFPDQVTESFSLPGGNAMAGVQGGANLQFGMLVVGIEADASATSDEGNAAADPSESAFNADPAIAQRMRWFGSTRARAGLAFGNVLVFATGGVAFGDLEYRLGVADFGAVAVDKTKVGWTGGGGFEIGLGAITFKAEYLYYDLGDERVVYRLSPDAFFVSDFETTGHTVRFGINFGLN